MYGRGSLQVVMETVVAVGSSYVSYGLSSTKKYHMST